MNKKFYPTPGLSNTWFIQHIFKAQKYLDGAPSVCACMDVMVQYSHAWQCGICYVLTTRMCTSSSDSAPNDQFVS